MKTTTTIGIAGLFAAGYTAAGFAYYKRTGRALKLVDVVKWPLTMYRDRKQAADVGGAGLTGAATSAAAGKAAGKAVPR